MISMTLKDRRSGKDRRRIAPISPANVRAAAGFNLAGLILMSLSMFVYNPMQFIITFIFGMVFLAAGFITWVVMVMREAMSKGLFE